MPRPPTIQKRFSRTIREIYWANGCPRCGTLQGDFYLHAEPDGPFFGLRGDPEDDTGERWRADMIRIAQAWAQRRAGG